MSKQCVPEQWSFPLSLFSSVNHAHTQRVYARTHTHTENLLINLAFWRYSDIITERGPKVNLKQIRIPKHNRQLNKKIENKSQWQQIPKRYIDDQEVSRSLSVTIHWIGRSSHNRDEVSLTVIWRIQVTKKRKKIFWLTKRKIVA